MLQCHTRSGGVQVNVDIRTPEDGFYILCSVGCVCLYADVLQAGKSTVGSVSDVFVCNPELFCGLSRAVHGTDNLLNGLYRDLPEQTETGNTMVFSGCPE